MTKHILYFFAAISVLWFIRCNSEPSYESEQIPQRPESLSSGDLEEEVSDGRQTILVLGNSLAAGYGIEPEEAFPALIQQKIDSLGWNFEVVNAGVSGETSSGGVQRIDWLLNREVDVLLLELGANDGLRGISPDVTKRNLQTIIDKTRSRNPDVAIVLAGMQMPPSMGQVFTERFREIFFELAEENDAHLVPFLLEGVGGVRQLNLPDGIHPTARGQRIIARNVWDVLKPVLEEYRQAV